MQIRALRPWLVAVSLILVGNYAAFYLFRVSAWSELECFEWLALFLSVICFGAGLGSLNLARPTVSGIALRAYQPAIPKRALGSVCARAFTGSRHSG